LDLERKLKRELKPGLNLKLKLELAPV